MTDHSLVVITGASSGIGAETARLFAEAGYPLLLIARRIGPMRELGLPHAMLRAADVNDTPAVARAIAEAEAEFGPADLLINNAGLMVLTSVVDQDPSDVQAMFDVNCVAPMKNAQLVLPGMIRRGRGTVINIGSIAGKQLYPDHTVYNGTKYAVHAMTEGLRREVAESGVRVVLVAPGMVDTALLSRTADERALDGYLEYKQQIGGGLTPVHVARTILSTYQLPAEVTLREVVVAPTAQDS